MKRIKSPRPHNGTKFVRIDARTVIETSRVDTPDDEIRNDFQLKVANSKPWIRSGTSAYYQVDM